MRNLTKTFLIALSLLINVNIYAQKKIDTALSDLAKYYTQEKIHLVLSKEQCVSGETIWFKGFVFSGYETSDISTNLYVDIYNFQNKIIGKCSYPIINGGVDGSFTLSDTLSEGSYYIHPYTNWMLNFDDSFEFLKSITVFNPKSKNALVKINKNNWVLSANTEGGNLLADIENKVAVRRIGSFDSIRKWDCYLVDVNNPSIKLVSFSSLDDNVAIFSFIPKLGINYRVIVEDNTKINKFIDLQKPLNKGANIQVDQHDSSLDYSINFKGFEFGKNFTLIGTNNNNLVYRLNFVIKDSIFFRSISTSNLPRGVLHFSLFDEYANLLSERLSFLKQNPFPPIHDSISINNNSRSYNEYGIYLDSGFNYNIVVAADAIDFANDFMGSIWLNSDFKNEIHHPSEYIENPNFNSIEALDAIMISEHWERFNWTKILSEGNKGLKFKGDNYLSFKGIVNYKKKPLINEKLSLFVFYPDSSRQVLQVNTDSLGQFIISGLAFYDKATITYKFLNKKLIKENGSLFFESIIPFESKHLKLPESKYELVPKESSKQRDASYIEVINKSKFQKNIVEREKTLADVVVRSKLKSATQLLDEKVSSGRFDIYGNLKVVDFVNTQQTTTDANAFDWLVAKGLIDVTIAKSYRYFIDEFPSNINDIKSIQASNIALLKVGAIGKIHDVHIYLKRGGENVLTPDPLGNTSISGYTKSIPFIMPNYFNDAFNKMEQDKRDILYWGNVFSLNNDGKKVILKYFNNDNPINVHVVVFGTDLNGSPFIKL